MLGGVEARGVGVRDRLPAIDQREFDDGAFAAVSLVLLNVGLRVVEDGEARREFARLPAVAFP